MREIKYIMLWYIDKRLLFAVQYYQINIIEIHLNKSENEKKMCMIINYYLTYNI